MKSANLSKSKDFIAKTRLVIQRQVVQRVVKSNLIAWNLLIAQKQQLNLNSHLSQSLSFEGENVEIGYTHPLLPKLSMTIERGEKLLLLDVTVLVNQRY